MFNPTAKKATRHVMSRNNPVKNLLCRLCGMSRRMALLLSCFTGA
jgi:hypothetical protein